MTIALRPYLETDARALANLFRRSIEILGQEDYSENQCAAWAAQADDALKFFAKLTGALTIVALKDSVLAGFASLDSAKIDMLYVDPNFIRMGVATTLVEALEKLSQARKIERLEVDASDCARDFFAKRGYEAIQRNSIVVNDEWLANTTMRKNLNAK